VQLTNWVNTQIILGKYPKMHNLSNRTLSLFSDSTKDILLKKSLELFNKKGFSAVTISSLASASDVLEGTLWYHFKSKKNLVESHIDLFDKNFKDEIDTNHKININTLINKLFSQYTFNWDFRYLFRDNFINIFPNDNSISDKLSDLNHVRFNRIKKEALFGREVGIFDFEDRDLEEIGEIIYLVADNWFDLSSKIYPDKDENFLIRRGLGLLIKVTEPYLSKGSKKIIKDLHGEFKK
jgi:AcrR family transcriptional regulator|tara:strand:+ start:216 stop:929 length:714 start_codon:yes stop_codon:yes gene_type:complete